MSRKAIILDRDGVLINNANHYYIWNETQLSFIDGMISNLKALSDKGYWLFIVTNQGGIAKGMYRKEDVFSIHERLVQELAPFGVHIKDIMICPHHDSIERCLCRKPEALMIERLVARYSLDKANTYFVGDSETDMQAAARAGIKGIRIEANKNMGPYIKGLLK